MMTYDSHHGLAELPEIIETSIEPLKKTYLAPVLTRLESTSIEGGASSKLFENTVGMAVS